MTDDAAREELRFLTRALRAHLEFQSATGATGLERAGHDTVHRGAVAAMPSAAADATERKALRPASANPAPRRLDLLAQAIRSCSLCGLSQHRKQTVFARGNGSSGVCFVGEAPGLEEDAQGLPFVGAAGQLLDRMIAAMGIHRDDVYVCNVVKCRPPDNREPEPGEMATCLPYLEEQLQLIAPKVIVALGATALLGLLGRTESITRLRGQWQTFRGQIPLMPTFHPAYLLRTPAAKREVWEDLQEVLRHIGRSVPGRR